MRRSAAIRLASALGWASSGETQSLDVVCLGPPFTIGDEEIDLICATLPRAIDAAVAAL